ncbi:MAG: polyphenol oxidase family protein [Akkermansiaceae bacterium]|nr:polyphenol oxidase family protein [Akkermansiaceae bacterium]MDG1669707.1 polyphenol oxidase family protein [Akkermansiaceae bacterium]
MKKPSRWPSLTTPSLARTFIKEKLPDCRLGNLAKQGRFRYASCVEEASFFLNPLINIEGVCADFVERVSGVPTSTNKEETLSKLLPHHTLAALKLGYTSTHLAEQVHGPKIITVTPDTPLISNGADGLISNSPGTLLGIHVADCGAVYLVDQRSKAIALLHSGKKGTEANITGQAIERMTQEFDSNPADLIAILAPCIRPPHYEIDFASTIREQALAAGISTDSYYDKNLCTASNLERYYSYRIEKGNTGRMLALLGILPS